MLSKSPQIFKDHLPKDGATHSGLGPLKSINIRDSFHIHAHRPPDLGNLLFESLFSDVSRLCQDERES